MTENANNVENTAKVFSEPTLRRLPIYYAYLKSIAEKGADAVSCTQIANDLNCVPVQVRKDLEVTDITGKPKIGYRVTELMKAIEDFLGWNNTSDAFLVGVGHLGTALLGYQRFTDYGLNIAAAFDVDPGKVGSTVNGKKVFPFERFPELVKRMKIRIGILAVPSRAAQETAEAMVLAGVAAIWNFAPVRISVPGNVIVQHENLASSLAVLSKKLHTALAGAGND